MLGCWISSLCVSFFCSPIPFCTFEAETDFLSYISAPVMVSLGIPFHCQRFRISAILFQYHKHQYPIRGRGRSCRAGRLSCARSFTGFPCHFDFGDYKLRFLFVHHSGNPRACKTFAVSRSLDTQTSYVFIVTRW